MTKEFMPKRVETYEADIARVVTEHLDRIEEAGPPSDFVEDFALSVPSTVIGQLLGIPPSDHEIFQDCTQKLTYRHASAEQGLDTNEERAAYTMESRNWVTLDEAISDMSDGTTEDTLSSLADFFIEVGVYSEKPDVPALVEAGLAVLESAKEYRDSK